jgi:hypothetical protein
MQQLHRQCSQRTGRLHAYVVRSNVAGFPTITTYSGTSCLITTPIHLKQSLPTVTSPMGYGSRGSALMGEVAGTYGKRRRMVQTLANCLHSPDSTMGEPFSPPVIAYVIAYLGR